MRSASPPTATTGRADTAEGSPAGERSGRGAVPGPAQDGETSTVDQSREWPYRDTAPRQDPAEARVDPIWGADPPDSVRWHIDMTADQAASGSGSTAAPTGSQGLTAAPPSSQGSTPAATGSQGVTAAPASSQGLTAAPPSSQGSTAPLASSEGVTAAPASSEGLTGSESEPRPDQHSLAGSPPAGVGTAPAVVPSGGSLSEQQGLIAGQAPAENEQAAGPGRDQASSLAEYSGQVYESSPSGSAEEGPSSQGAGPPVGWFSTDPTSFTGSFTEQLSAQRPVDAPSRAPGVEADAASQDAATNAESIPGAESSLGADPSLEAEPRAEAEPSLGAEPSPGVAAPVGSRGPDGIDGSRGPDGFDRSLGPDSSDWPVAPEGSASASTASSGAGTEPGRPGTRSPDLIEAGMVYVDPDPGIGSSLASSERLEGSDPPPTATERMPSGAEDAPIVGPSTSADPGQAPGVSGPARDVSGEPELATAAVAEPYAAPTEPDAVPTESDASPTSTSTEPAAESDASLASIPTEPAAGPWTEPALPGLPAGVPPSVSQGSIWRDEESPDDVLVPPPDPTWPRLFGQRPGDQASSGSGEAVHPEDGAMLAPGSGEEESPPHQDLEPGTSPRTDVGETRSTGADRSAGDRLPGGPAIDGGATGLAGEHLGEPAGPADVAVQSDHVAIVGLTTGDPRADRDPEVSQGPWGEASAAQPMPGARAVPGAQATEHANISTVARTAEAEEVDVRETSPGPTGDVSRETSTGGDEEMEPIEEEVVEDEAAVAVREAVSRAAAEAGVDVSRETSIPEEEPPVDGLVGEPSVDSETAARNARVTFRIHREALNGTRRVMAVANQKGGVGKSTTAVNIGAYLALAGARVLVVDLDPQGNASTGLGLDHREIEPSIYDVLTGEAPTASAIRSTSVANLHVLPSTIDLAGAEVELVSAMSRETRLRRALESIDHQYDTVLIDCPPSLGLLTVNALAAANELLIPIQCEYYALEGLGQLLRNVELVRANLNPELRIGGIVLTMYDGRTRLALQVVEEVRKHFTDIVYQTVVPRSVRLSEAPGYGVPIALYDPLSRGGIAYRDLTFELAERTGLLAPTGEGAS